MEETQPLWKSLLGVLAGLGMLGAAWYLNFPLWLGLGVLVLVLWDKTIRPAIIELIREALR